MATLELGNLSSNEFDRLQEAADRFEQVFRADSSADLADFVPPADNPLRSLILQELVKTDIELRWRRGQKPLLEDYLQRFHELADDKTCVVALLSEEWHVRQQCGDEPALALYRSRFPNHYADFERVIQKHLTACHTPTAAAHATPNPKPVPAPKPSAQGDFLPVGGGYQLLERIGTGGFGEVWRAEAPGGVQVAVKVIFRPMDDQEVHRELEALELMKGLRHPCLLQIQAFWPLRDRVLIVMELADRNLRDRLRECVQAEQPGLPVDELVAYFREAAEALDYLHSNHVQHRDVKPDNMLLIGRHAKLADFGLLRMVESQRAVSVSGSGTPAYMAPEVWRGKGCAQSDQYSLAVSYAEIRMQRNLFADRHWMQLMLAHLDREPDLAKLGRHEQAVVRKALAKKAEDRYPNCLAFVADLEQAARADAAEATATDEGSEDNQPATFLLPEEKITEQVDIDASDDVELGTLDLVEGPEGPEDEATLSEGEFGGLVATMVPAEAFEEPLVSVSFVAPPPMWKLAAQPRRRSLRPVAWCLAAVLGGLLLAFGWHVHHRRSQSLAHDVNAPAKDDAPTIVVAPKPAKRETVPANLYDLEEPTLVPLADSPAAQAFERGRQHYVKGDWAAAAAAFTEAIEADARFAVYYRARGLCFYMLKRYGQAFNDFDQAVKLYPGFAKALVNRAMAYVILGNYAAAVADVDRALEIQPNQPPYLVLRGAIRRHLGQPQLALADLSAALELQPENVAGRFQRGHAHADLGHYRDAIADFTYAIQQRDDYAVAYLGRAQAYVKLGDLDEALADYEKAVALNAYLGSALLGRGELRLLRGQAEEAKADFVAAMNAPIRDEAIVAAACAGLYRAWRHASD